MKRMLIAVFSVAVLAGCTSTYAVHRYSISADNVVALKSIGHEISVGAFTQAQVPNQSPGEIMCRAVAPIKTPDGEPFAAFIRNALISELKLAGVYADTAPISLSGHLDSIDFSTVKGAWDIQLTITSSNGKSMTQAVHYSFTSSYYGETACNQAAQAFMPSVQDLLAKVVRSPDFPSLLK
ncbi:conserved exported hypothetical protein [Paraburkholderia ribeironis]|uniref:Lipoprotein n=1 Tax=Paraburkholderia ribeironis TaxID=1247936 RepID=A0A1N7RJI7_9BURK|nr:hypothetical protein [Paraburkholderia ribeironis]SIT34857.1 conserved exported hypothetical protein [Paraburkholderia ribeironis]